jgi:hypothetical protein
MYLETYVSKEAHDYDGDENNDDNHKNHKNQHYKFHFDHGPGEGHNEN